jgi:hypothetical protein
VDQVGDTPASVHFDSLTVIISLWVGWMSDLELRGILISVTLMNNAMTIRFSLTLLTVFLMITGLVVMPGFASPDQSPSELWLQDQDKNASQMDAAALSDQQIAEDLARIQAAFEEDEVLEEFIPSEPLSADIAVSFPSDI